MSWRPAVVAAMMLSALALGGCAQGVAGVAGYGAPFPGDAQHAVVQAEPVVQVEPVVQAEPVAPVVAGWSRTQVVAAAETPDHLYVGHHQSYIVEGNPQRPYRLDSGDRLRVFVYGQPNLSRLYPVDQSGLISVPLIGTVKVRSLTTKQVEGAIRSQLGAKYVRDPQVTVDIAQYRPFFILGEVRNPGQYPYVNGMTVETAVAIAGGYSERASQRRIRLKRRIDGAIGNVKVDTNFEVEPGDSIFVHERFF